MNTPHRSQDTDTGAGVRVTRRGTMAVAAATAVGSGAVAGTANAGDTRQPGERAPRTVVVQLDAAHTDDSRTDTNTSVEQRKRHARECRTVVGRAIGALPGVEINTGFWAVPALLVEVNTAVTTIEQLEQHDGVKRVYANYQPRRPAASDDRSGTAGPATAGDRLEQSDRQQPETTRGLEQVRAPQLWEAFGTRGAGVDVAVLDTGVDPTGHDGIRAALERGDWVAFDTAGERRDKGPNDPDGHGTAVSGIVVGGQTDDGTRYGVAPGANLYHIQLADSFAGTVAAVEWAVDNAVDIFSASVGPVRYSQAWPELVETLRAAGILPIGSIANTSRYTSVSFANLPTAVGVGAVDRAGSVTEWSAGEEIQTDRYWGDTARADWPERYTVPELVAPGVGVTSAEPGGGYSANEGASYSVPHVAGVAALVIAGTDAETGTEIEELLLETARHPAENRPFAVEPATDDRAGQGIPSALRAVSAARASETVTGTVTDADGDPIAGATVASETGLTTTTDERGRYALTLPGRDQPIGATAGGFDATSAVLNPETTEQRSFELSRTADLSAALQSTLPQRVDPGEQPAATLTVANAATVVVSAETEGPITDENVRVGIDGETHAVDQRIELDASRVDTVAVSVGVTGGVGVVRPTIRVADGRQDEVVTGDLGTIHVHPDPWRIEREAPSLQAVTTVAAPQTTVELPAEPTPARQPDRSCSRRRLRSSAPIPTTPRRSSRRTVPRRPSGSRPTTSCSGPSRSTPQAPRPASGSAPRSEAER